MLRGLGKRSLDRMAPISQVPEASEIILNVQKISGTALVNKNQCKLVADRCKAIGEGLKELDKGFVSGKPFDGSTNMVYPAFDELLVVLRKAEALLLSNRGSAVDTVISRGDNREAFQEIHEELDIMKAKFPFEGFSGHFELTTGHERSVILIKDAEKDLEEMKGFAKSLDDLSPGDEQKVEKVVTEKSKPREARDGLPSFLNIDLATIQIDAKPIREQVRLSEQDSEVGFDWARVHSGSWLGCGFAVKVFNSGESTWDRNQLLKEASILVELRHPHIIRFTGFARDSRLCCHLMELMDGDLRNFMIKSRLGRPFTHSDKLDIITQIAKGMLYLHTRGYVHGDLKCSNILVKRHGDYIEVKIGDLRGAMKLGSVGDLSDIAPSVRRPRWTAPEAINNYDGNRPSDELLRKSDIYSFAMTCYEVVSGKLPFQDTRGAALLELIRGGGRPELPADLDDGLRGFIEACWDTDPNKRPSFEIICHFLDVMRSSKPAVSNMSSGKGKVITDFKQIPKVVGVFRGLFAEVQAKEHAGEPTPTGSTSDTISDESAGQGGSSPPLPIKAPEYLRINPVSLKILKIVGKGAFAKVFMVTWLGCTFAMKTFKPTTPILDLQQELNFLTQLRHPHIVQMVGFSTDTDGRCSIVMEFMKGNLQQLIKSRMKNREKVPFDFHEALSIITQIAWGMAFLHSRGVSHRDLKGLNVMCQEYADSIDVRIVDFGVSQHIDSSGEKTTGTAGTGFWRAPEIFPLEINKSRKCDLMKTDVYSFAMTCYEVLTGRFPFENQLKLKDYEKVVSGDRPPLPGNLDSGLKLLIEKCWHAVPEQRPSFAEICNELQQISIAYEGQLGWACLIL